MNKKRFFYSLPVILLLIVAVVGWFVTDYLGNQARQEIIEDSRSDASTLSIHLSDTLNNFEGAVKSLAGSPSIVPILQSKGDQDIELTNSTLDRYNSAIKASVTYLMAADGITVASSNRKDPDSFLGKSYRFRPYFQAAAKGQPGRYFGLGMTSGKRGFYASCPVQDRLGKLLGVVAMKKDLDEMETFFSQYPLCFLINPEGIIFLSSTPAMVLKSLWPLDKTAQEKLIASQQFGNKLSETVTFKKEITDGMEITLEGKNYFVSRKVIDSDGWSIVVLTPTGRIWIYRWIGILATLSVCFLIVIFSAIIYVTERSIAAIRQSEELHKALAEESIAGVYVLQDGKFRFINSNAASYAGYTREEMLGQEVSLLVSPEDMEKVKQNARAMLRGEMSSPYEFRIITKQGETRWIMETVISILHEGRPAILGNSMDITERKQVEERLRKSEERFKSLYQESPIPTFTWQKKGDDFVLINFNEAAIQLTNGKVADILGSSTVELYRDMPQVLNDMNLCYKEQSTIRREMTSKHFAPGRFLSVNYGFISPDLIIVHTEDQTDRKQAEEELRISRSQLRALAMHLQQIREEERTMISREIHDEMGGGLTGLKMDLSWLLRKMGDADPCEERVALLDKIHTSNALIDQMIKVVRRISADLRPSVLDDLGLIAALEWQLSEFTSRTEIPHEFATTFEYVNMEKDTAVAVFRIFQEALTNVMRHSGATKVVVVLREDERSLFGDESLILEIRDNGRGITEEEILNPESLGLLGIKERVLVFKGEISIRGKPGGGTSVILKIPRIQGEPS
jgi:PAS domain S-box-containing protein